MNRISTTPAPARFRPFPLLLGALVLLMLISQLSRWYATEVSLPRYCRAPEETLHRLAAVLGKERPAGDESRRDYIVAAKLKYLVPAQVDESNGDYLQRLREFLEERCR